MECLQLIVVFLLQFCFSCYILRPSCGRAYMEARLPNGTGYSPRYTFSHSTFDYRISQKEAKPATQQLYPSRSIISVLLIQPNMNHIC